jgi:hypothetical protein
MVMEENKCPLCEIGRWFCNALPNEYRGKCMELFDKIVEGKISGKEAREELRKIVPEEFLERATEKVKELIEHFSSVSSVQGQSEQSQA